MKTREEIEELLDQRLPLGPETDREIAVQETLDWVLGNTPDPPL